MKYAFIGLGNMASAILRGMHASRHFKEDELWGFNRSPEKTEALARDIGLRALPSATEAASADVLVLAVKPQMMEGVLQDLAPHLSPATLVITIAAGLPLAFYEARLPKDQPILRAMPSLNARVGQSCTALCANAAASAAHLVLGQALFASVGTVEVIDEGQFSAFSAIAGAAPAFAFQFVDALASAGVKHGLPRALAQRVATQMLKGSALLMESSTDHPRQLMDQVASPGGTTIEGLHALNRLGFDGAVQEAVGAVVEKDRKLGKKE